MSYYSHPCFWREENKKNQPYLPPEDGFKRLKAGFLTFGSSSSQAFPPFESKGSGFLWDSSPITVAGAVSASHGLPLALNLILNCQRRKTSLSNLVKHNGVCQDFCLNSKHLFSRATHPHLKGYRHNHGKKDASHIIWLFSFP
jgi:hypothetical protein